MPSTRLAMPSGRNSSNLSVPSPMPTKRTGAPVTSFTLSAAPPRASPSSFVRMTPVRPSALVEALRDLDRVLADHRVDDEEDVLGLDCGLDVGELLHERLVDREATGGVVDDDVAADASSPRPRRASQIVDAATRRGC